MIRVAAPVNIVPADILPMRGAWYFESASEERQGRRVGVLCNANVYPREYTSGIKAQKRNTETAEHDRKCGIIKQLSSTQRH